MIKKTLRMGIAFFLGFPFLFLILKFPLQFRLDLDEMVWAFSNSFWQAFGSAGFSLILGLWGAFGLVCFSDRTHRLWRTLFEVLLLLPNFVPALFVLLSVLNFVDPFPMGLPGIILVHTLMNWGMVAVLAARLFEQRLGGMAELALIEGVSFWKFLRQVFFPLLWKDLSYLWLLVFAICFSSFSVPLVVGGGRGTTVEVLIYERIRFSSDWSEAVLLAVLQTVFLLMLSWVLISSGSRPLTQLRNLSLLRMRTGVAAILIFTTVFISGYLEGLPEGFERLHELKDLVGEIAWAACGTFVLCLLAGSFSLILLMGLAGLMPSRWLSTFLTGYTAPSSALAGFALMALGPNGGAWPLVKIPIALVLIFLPALWRMGWQRQIESIEGQKQVAQTLGASDWQIWRRIVVPQLAPQAGTMAGIASVWAGGDFAISRLMASTDLTLGMMTETLISSGYRLGLATWMSLLLLFVVVISFLLFKGIGYVLSRKSLL